MATFGNDWFNGKLADVCRIELCVGLLSRSFISNIRIKYFDLFFAFHVAEQGVPTYNRMNIMNKSKN